MSTVGSSSRFARGLSLNIAENLAAALDFDLAIADRPRDPASRLDQQPVVDDEVALETAADLSLVDGGGTLEQASFRNLNDAAVGQFDVDATFDEQLVAGSDFAGQGDPPANVETAGAVHLGGIGEIGEPTQGLTGARRDCLRPSCTNGLGQKASFFGRIWHLRILSLHLPQTMGLRTRAAWGLRMGENPRISRRVGLYSGLGGAEAWKRIPWNGSSPRFSPPMSRATAPSWVGMRSAPFAPSRPTGSS